MWDAGEWMGSAAVHVFIPRQPVWSAWRQSTRIGLGRYGTLHCSSFPSRTASPVSYKIEASVLWELKIILAHHFPISLTLSSFLSGKTLHNTEHPISHGSWQAFSGLQLLRCPLQLSSSPCHPQLCSWEQGSVKSCTPCCPSTATRFLTSHKNPRAKLLDICCVLSVCRSLLSCRGFFPYHLQWRILLKYLCAYLADSWHVKGSVGDKQYKMPWKKLSCFNAWAR